MVGFLAPTSTTILWAVGSALVGDSLHWRVPYRPWIYIAVAVAFTVCHVSHATIVFPR